MTVPFFLYTLKEKMNLKAQKNILFALALFVVGFLYAQKPTEVPKPSQEPIDLTNPADVIIYIILPLCAVLFFFIWVKKRKKNK